MQNLSEINNIQLHFFYSYVTLSYSSRVYETEINNRFSFKKKMKYKMNNLPLDK